MKPSRKLPVWSIALALLVACFVWAGYRVLSRTGPAADDRVVIRIAHWQLEAGVHNGLETVAREFESLHPGVRIEILRIPERVYPAWLTTQLVGDTAPDLIELRANMPIEQKARYFRLLGEVVEQPNPFNAGTSLADTPWRDTFVDGMRGGFDEALGDHFGAPAFISTIRLFYNEALLEEITGDKEPPRTLAELLRLCDRVASHPTHGGGRLLPIAGSSYNAPYLFDALMRAQLQQLAQAYTPRPRLLPEPESIFASARRGEWTLDHPDVRRTLELQRELGRHLQPGFLQLRREDATFRFAQQQALMITTGSWDATSLRQESAFSVGVFHIPAPEPGDPRWGGGVLGRVSEEGTGAFGPFGIARSSAHPQTALAFLQFLTSQKANRTFSRLSGWLPVIVGVEPPEEVVPFMPTVDGYPGAFSLRYSIETRQAYERHLHALFSPAGGVDRFIETMDRDFPEAITGDLLRILRSRERTLRQTDSVLEAWRQINRGAPSSEAHRRHATLAEAQLDLETEAAWLRWELAR